MSYIPSELTYEAAAAPEAVVVSRSEAFLTSPTPTHDSSANVIRFHLTGNQMLDLASVRMYATLDWVMAAPAAGAGDAEEICVNSTFGIFSSLEIASGGGVVIERIDDAVCLSQIVANLSYAKDWSEGPGSFLNAQLDPRKRWRDPATTRRFQIGALKLLGFLQSGKFVNPNAFGGLVFTFTLAPVKQLLSRNADDATAGFGLRMTDVKLHYDVCTMSNAYTQWFDQQYLRKGFRVVWDSYQAHTSVALSSGEGDVHLPMSGRRVKAIMMVVRPQTHSNSILHENSSTAFISNVTPGYSFEVSGTRYPPTPITEYQRAYTEALKLCYATGDHQRCGMGYDHFTNNFRIVNPAGAAATDTIAFQGGKLVMCMDFEKFNTSGESGITVPPTGLTAVISMNGLTGGATKTLDAYMIRSQSVTVVAGSVMVDF